MHDPAPFILLSETFTLQTRLPARGISEPSQLFLLLPANTLMRPLPVEHVVRGLVCHRGRGA